MLDDVYKRVRDICRNVGVSKIYYDDFVQDIMMILLKMDKEKIEEMYTNNQLNFFITRIVKNQWFSNTSPFYKVYRKQYERYDGNITDVIEMENKDGCEVDE